MNAIELAEAVKEKRRADRLTLEQLGDRLEVGAGTLSRIENQIGFPDMATLAKLSAWLGVPVSRLIGEAAAVSYLPSSSTPDIVAAHLRADPNLTPEAAQRLGDLFNAMYREMVKA